MSALPPKRTCAVHYSETGGKTLAAPVTSDTDPSLGPDAFEKFLAAAAVVLFILVSIALLRGHDAWLEVRPLLWLHLASVMLPLAITPVQLLRRRGDGVHRTLGWIWASALPPKADICSAPAHVRFGPIADIQNDYDRSGSNAAARGKITLISVNSPGSVSTSIEPPCCLTMMS